MNDQRIDGRIARSLKEPRNAQDPPDGLTAAVMKDVADVEASFSGWRRWWRARRAARLARLSRFELTPAQHARGGIVVSIRTRLMIAVALAAVVGIAVVLVTGYPPLGSGSQGTVGAAKRYQGA